MTGSEYIPSWTEIGASLKGSQGLSPTGNDWLSVSASKYGAYEAARTEVSTTIKVTEPLLLTMALSERGREQLASLRMEAARSGRRAFMSAVSG